MWKNLICGFFRWLEIVIVTMLLITLFFILHEYLGDDVSEKVDVIFRLAIWGSFGVVVCWQLKNADWLRCSRREFKNRIVTLLLRNRTPHSDGEKPNDEKSD